MAEGGEGGESGYRAIRMGTFQRGGRWDTLSGVLNDETHCEANLRRKALSPFLSIERVHFASCGAETLWVTKREYILPSVKW